MDHEESQAFAQYKKQNEELFKQFFPKIKDDERHKKIWNKWKELSLEEKKLYFDYANEQSRRQKNKEGEQDLQKQHIMQQVAEAKVIAKVINACQIYKFLESKIRIRRTIKVKSYN